MFVETHRPAYLRPILRVITTLAAVFSAYAHAAPADLPDPASGAFCQRTQQILANTDMTGNVTVFDNMPDYRHSKPSAEPLNIYQVVTYDGQLPIAVSCKVKAADHLRAAYGEAAAGPQETCKTMADIALAQAIRDLDAANLPQAVEHARGFIMDDNEPYMMGVSYLEDFELSYKDENGRVHIQSPGLQTDWDNLLLWVMPNRVRGQTYCHLATVPYIKSLATGAVKPGTQITTTEAAVTTPASR